MLTNRRLSAGILFGSGLIALLIIGGATGIAPRTWATVDWQADSVDTASASQTATFGGISIEVLGAEFNGLDLRVELRFDSTDPELGELETYSPPTLVLDNGNEIVYAYSSAGLANPEIHSIMFHNVPALQLSSLTLRLDAIAFRQAISDPKEEAGRPDAGRRVVAGEWALKIPPVNVVQGSPSRASSLQRAPFGPGTLAVETVSRTSDEIVVTGRYEGFSRDLLHEIVPFPATLTIDGSVIESNWYSGGFGEGDAQFEFRFPAVDATSAELTVPFLLPGVNSGGRPMQPDVVEAARDFISQPAVLAIDFP